MNSFDTLAWIGTGQCRPDKELHETMIVLAVVAGWAVIIYLLRELWRSKLSKAAKVLITIAASLLGIGLTGYVYFISLLLYAC